MPDSAQGDRSEQILALCEGWVAAGAQPGGGFAIGDATEQYRLMNNGLVPQEMTHSELLAACVGLTRVLILPGLTTVIDRDHKWFWAWCGEILGSTWSGYLTESEHELRERLRLTIRAALARTDPPSQMYEANQLIQRLNVHDQQLLYGSDEILVHLSFPLLEGLARKACRAFVDYEGKVLLGFTAAGRSYSVGQTCSNLGHVLHLLRAEVASAELAVAMDRMAVVIANLGSGDAWNQLFRWRNSTLHGATSYSTIGGTVLNVAMLISLDGIQTRYDELQALAIRQGQRAIRDSGSRLPRPPSSFFPPYWPIF